MKNLVILILLIIVGCQALSYSNTRKELYETQENYINLQICIEEGIL